MYTGHLFSQRRYPSGKICHLSAIIITGNRPGPPETDPGSTDSYQPLGGQNLTLPEFIHLFIFKVFFKINTFDNYGTVLIQVKPLWSLAISFEATTYIKILLKEDKKLPSNITDYKHFGLWEAGIQLQYCNCTPIYLHSEQNCFCKVASVG